MALYSLCAKISDDPEIPESAEPVPIMRLITDPEYRNEMHRFYKKMLSSTTSVEPLFQVNTENLFGKMINAETESSIVFYSFCQNIPNSRKERENAPLISIVQLVNDLHYRSVKKESNLFFRVIENIERYPELLADGSFGVSARHPNGEQANFTLLSLKRKGFNRRNITENDISWLIRLSSCWEHPNIMELYGKFFTRNKNETKIEIMSEFMNRESLWSYVRNTSVDYEIHLQIAIQVARGLEYILCKGYAYPKITARNVFLHQNNPGDELIAKIDGLGLLLPINDFEYQQETIGPIDFFHLKNKSRKDTRSTRLFLENSNNLGVVLWEMATKCTDDPFNELGEVSHELASFIMRGPFYYMPEGYPYELYNIMKSCLSLDPYERYDITILRRELETLLNPWAV